MDIDRTGITSLDTGASDITYSGNEGPQDPRAMTDIDKIILQHWLQQGGSYGDDIPEEFRQEIIKIYGLDKMASAPEMAEGGIARLGYASGQLVQPGPGRPGYGGNPFGYEDAPAAHHGDVAHGPGGRFNQPSAQDPAANIPTAAPSLGTSLHGGKQVADIDWDRMKELNQANKTLELLEADKEEELVEKFRNKQIGDIDAPGFFGVGLNFLKGPFQKGSTATRNFFLDKVLRSNKQYIRNLTTKYGNFFDLTNDEQEDFYQDYISARHSGTIDAYGNPMGGGGGDDTPGGKFYEPMPEWQRLGYPSYEAWLAAQGTETEIEPLDEFDVARQGLIYADGGRAGYAGGGDVRQNYGLGKLVKKAFKAVGKVAKSPIGMAALTMGLGGLGGVGPFKGLRGTALGKMIMGTPWQKGPQSGVEGGLWNWAKDYPFWAIGGASALGGLYTAAAPDEGEEPSWYEKWLADQKKYMAEIGEFPVGRGDLLYDRTLSADGGRIGYDNGGYLYDEDEEEGHRSAALRAMYKNRMGAQEGGLMDLGGMEKDYRQEGGFVPIGGQERADDVPARLSKNEFVFTADAVRAAGGGDIDKGAEVMENVMENLEQGGQVSEESQGLEGARNMFATAQRLEGVL